MVKAVAGYLVGAIGFCLVISAVQIAIIGGRPASIRGRDVPAQPIEMVVMHTVLFALLGALALWAGKKLYEADEY